MLKNKKNKKIKKNKKTRSNALVSLKTFLKWPTCHLTYDNLESSEK